MFWKESRLDGKRRVASAGMLCGCCVVYYLWEWKVVDLSIDLSETMA